MLVKKPLARFLSALFPGYASGLSIQITGSSFSVLGEDVHGFFNDV